MIGIMKLCGVNSMLLALFINGCYMDVVDDSDCCGLFVDNQSTARIYVGSYFVSHLSEDGTVNPELNIPIWGYEGYVEKNTKSNRFYLAHVNKDAPTYAEFFETYGIDTLNILVTDDQNKIGYWEECKNDSLLLKRYKLTKYNVDTTKQDIYINYP